MFKKSVWRKTASEAVCFHQDQALNTTILLLKTYGPTGFLLREEGDASNYKVFLGDPHSCTCPVFVREQESCKHICWVLLRKFRLPREHEYSLQSGLSERQISEVLHGSHQTRVTQTEHKPPAEADSPNQTHQEPGSVSRKVIQAQDVCPICQEELLEKRQPVCFCRFSCGNNVHISCMRVWAEHQKLSDKDEMVKCPLCREDFSTVRSLWEQVRNANKLHTAAEKERPDKHLGVPCYSCRVCPITGKCFKCTICSYVYLCETCSERGCHSHHQFVSRTKRKEVWRLLSKESSGAPPVNENIPVLVEPLPDSVLVHLSLIQVRPGSQLLDEGQQCRICLQRFTLGQSVRSLPCRHKFHASCVDVILRANNSCPLDGYVIYNPVTWRKTTPKLARDCTKQSTPNSFNDLFVPGVALQEKKRDNPTQATIQTTNTLTKGQTRVLEKKQKPSLDTTLSLTHLGNTKPLSMKKLKSKSGPPLAVANIGKQPAVSLHVGVLKAEPQIKVFPCRRVRLQPKIRSTNHKPLASELTMTGVFLETQRKT